MAHRYGTDRLEGFYFKDQIEQYFDIGVQIQLARGDLSPAEIDDLMRFLASQTYPPYHKGSGKNKCINRALNIAELAIIFSSEDIRQKAAAEVAYRKYRAVTHVWQDWRKK